MRPHPRSRLRHALQDLRGELASLHCVDPRDVTDQVELHTDFVGIAGYDMAATVGGRRTAVASRDSAGRHPGPNDVTVNEVAR